LTDRGEDSDIGALRRALGYLHSYRRESIGMFVSLLLVSGANLAAPLLIGRAIDDGISPRNSAVVFMMVGGLVAR